MLFDESEHVEREFVFKPPLGAESSEEVRLKLLGWEKSGGDGDIVWRGAYVTATELVGRRAEVRGKRVVELGAGSGLLGALCAHFGAHAVITDGDQAEMPVLGENAERFRDELSLGGTLAAGYLEWGLKGLEEAEAQPGGGAAPLRRGGFDLVIGSDIVYIPEFIDALAESIALLLADSGEALIANTAVATRTSHAEARAQFLAALEKTGLRVELEEHPDGPAFMAMGNNGLPSHSYFLRMSWPEGRRPEAAAAAGPA